MCTPTRAVAEEHTVVVGAGGTVEGEVRGGSLEGFNAMVEVEAIESWLELELEASIVSAEGGIELPIALLFKKPFRITRQVEVMLGFGPEMLLAPASARVYGGMECAVDFMFWPTKRVGFWIEPSYDVVLRLPASSGVGGTAGVMVGF
jgi:hypothetical protein